MKRFIMLFFVVAVFSACEKSGNLIKDGLLTNESLISQLNGTKWQLKECPTTNFISLNGHGVCDYFLELEFIDNKVYIQHNNNQVPTPHHICMENDNGKLPVSIQDCQNTTWRPWFHWKITSLSSTTLEFNLQDLNFYQNYSESFTFTKM